MSEKENSHDLISLEANDISAGISLRGAALQSLCIKEGSGSFRELILDPLTEADYALSLAGASLFPCAGRIRKGELDIGGTLFQLEKNDGDNHIHGGSHGAPHRRFELIDFTQGAETSSVRLGCHLEDGLDGWPGNRAFTVTYTLTGREKEHSLRIDFSAVTDRETYVDMSNHTYWNLNGRAFESGSGLDQLLQIDADEVLLNDGSHLPYEKVSVSGSCFDYRSPKLIRQLMEDFKEDSQLINARGYNNAFILKERCHSSPEIWPAATLCSSDGKLIMKLHTDQPSLVLYSGGYLPAFSGAVALEAQSWPDAPNFKGAPYSTLKRGERYHSFILFELFSKL